MSEKGLRGNAAYQEILRERSQNEKNSRQQMISNRISLLLLIDKYKYVAFIMMLAIGGSAGAGWYGYTNDKKQHEQFEELAGISPDDLKKRSIYQGLEDDINTDESVYKALYALAKYMDDNNFTIDNPGELGGWYIYRHNGMFSIVQLDAHHYGLNTSGLNEGTIGYVVNERGHLYPETLRQEVEKSYRSLKEIEDRLTFEESFYGKLVREIVMGNENI